MVDDRMDDTDDHTLIAPSPAHRCVLRAAIDASIAEHRRAIHALEVRRNALAPASTLPPELLVRVLGAIPVVAFRASVRQLQGVIARDGSIPPAWATAGRVCRRWRAATLSGALVRRIDMVHSTCWTDELVRRADGRALAMRLAKASIPAVQQFIYLAERHANGLDEMEVMCGPAQEGMLIALLAADGSGGIASLGQPFPHLHTLELRGPHGAFYTLPHTIDGTRLPNLRHLTLYNVVLNRKVPDALLAQFSSLDVAYDVAHVGTLSLPIVLERLGHATALARLVIRLAAQSRRAADWDAQLAVLGAVTIPTLRHLTVEAPESILGQIVGALDSPQVRTTELRSAVWTDTERVASWLASPETAAKLTGTGIHARPFTALAFTSSRQQTRMDWTDPTGMTRLSLVSEHARAPLAAPALTALFHARGARLTSLTVSSAPGHSTLEPAMGWARALGALVELERLALGHDDGWAILRMMDAADGAAWFPRLRHLALVGLDCFAITDNLLSWIEYRTAGAGTVPDEVVVAGYDASADTETGEAEVREVLGAMLREYGPEGARVVWDWKVVWSSMMLSLTLSRAQTLDGGHMT
jgi:hypothetical protein